MIPSPTRTGASVGDAAAFEELRPVQRCGPRQAGGREQVQRGGERQVGIGQAGGEKLEAAHAAVSKVIEVDDFAPEALSPIYRKAADVHQFFQELGEQRAAS